MLETASHDFAVLTVFVSSSVFYLPTALLPTLLKSISHFVDDLCLNHFQIAPSLNGNLCLNLFCSVIAI